MKPTVSADKLTACLGKVLDKQTAISTRPYEERRRMSDKLSIAYHKLSALRIKAWMA